MYCSITQSKCIIADRCMNVVNTNSLQPVCVAAPVAVVLALERKPLV